jgi:hypothetical protein
MKRVLCTLFLFTFSLLGRSFAQAKGTRYKLMLNPVLVPNRKDNLTNRRLAI